MLSSIKAKLRQKFNVAVAEVGYHDKWQRSLLAVVAVGVDGVVVEATCSHVLRFLEGDRRLTVLDCIQELR